MNAKKCDRCGGYYNADPDTIKSFLTSLVNSFEVKGKVSEGLFVWVDDKGGAVPVIDLCSKCTRSLHKWYRAFKKDEEGATDERPEAN